MKKAKYLPILSLAVVGSLYGTSPVLASPILMPDLASFTVLGASTVTNVPTSTIGGNVGVWSSGGANDITGFLSSPGVAVSDPQVTGGQVHAGTAAAQAAQSQLTTARTGLGSLGAGTILAADMVGLTLFPGIYTVPAGTTNLSGALTLDGQGNANAAWVFQMDSTLITSSNSVVNVINTGAGAGVFWNVASSATIGTNTSFMGNILALASITMDPTATDLCGRVLADTAAVTLQMNTLSGVCAGNLAGSGGLGGGLDVTASGVNILPFLSTNSTVPEPSTLILLMLGAVGFVNRGLINKRF
ncbi:MAG: DUF3494 domain-containing protein [Methylovulum sp.]|nr:DUF3494 domain-containing protein [Methylovulum sp.]